MMLFKFSVISTKPIFDLYVVEYILKEKFQHNFRELDAEVE